MSVRTKISQQRVKELLHYDPETGVFTWRVGGNGRVKGAQAGHVHVHGYRVMRVDGNKVHAQRLAWLYMTGDAHPGQIRFRNGERDDLRWTNLVLRKDSPPPKEQGPAPGSIAALMRSWKLPEGYSQSKESMA